MRFLPIIGLVLLSGFTAFADPFLQGEIRIATKTKGMRYDIKPIEGNVRMKPKKNGFVQDGAYDKWTCVAFELEAKDPGHYYVSFAASYASRHWRPEIAWTDFRFEGVSLENLDLKNGIQGWGLSTKSQPRLETVDGKRSLIARDDRIRYRRLDLKAGQKVKVTAMFRPFACEPPSSQLPLDISSAVNATIPEGVGLSVSRRDFIGIYISTLDPANYGGRRCVAFRNRNIQSGVKSLTLLDAPAKPARYLYMLAASSYTSGTNLATAEVKYADGTTRNLKLVRDEHIVDWSRSLSGDFRQAVHTSSGENGTRYIYLVRVVLDERKALEKIILKTEENSNLYLFGATLTCDDWKPKQIANKVFRLGGEWRKADMPSRDIPVGSALDLSNQMDFAPCGSHGRILQKGEHLYFEKKPNHPIRFFGNHSSHVWVCDWEPDENHYCQQMQRVGCNAIRLSLSRLDGDWWFEPSENRRRFKISDGLFVDDRIDNLMRFIAAFNRHGIYLLFGSGTGPQEIAAMMSGDAESREHYRQLTIRLLTRRNPYTGNLVKDEPCVIGWEFPNEQSVQHVCHHCAFTPNPNSPLSSVTTAQQKYVERLRKLIKPRWEAFLKKRYGANWESHSAYPKRYTTKTSNALDFQQFSQELMEDQIAFYYSMMKEVGWDKPVMWGNFDKILRTSETRVKMGMATEVNNYHSFLSDYGHGPQVSSAADGMSTFRDIAGAAIPGKTVFVTEFNDSQHNKYCHEMGLAAGSIASLQGWDAFFLHNSTVLTDKFSPPKSFNIDDGLVIAPHLSMRASTFLAACLYGRGDAAASSHTVKLDYTKAFMNTPSSTSYPDSQQLRTVMLCRTRVDWPEYGMTPEYKADLTFPGFGNDSAGTYEFLLAQASDSKTHTAVLETMVAKMREKGVLKPNNRTNVKEGVYESDTGEILIETTVPRMKTVTTRSEALTLPANGAYRADCLEVVQTKNNATFAAVAMDKQPLEKSGRIVVIMDGESAIDGTEKTPDRVRYINYNTPEGRKRLRGEKIWRTNVAQLRLRNTKGGAFTLYPLSVNGLRRDPIPVTREGDELVFTLDTSAKTLPYGITPYFELVATTDGISAPTAQ